ncbi:hypothetical protein P175DRAFT_0520762 [Aspergillus ochraceoroseus IBT 24754]|uniref:Major facilitator superfamily (MFS) profile domain-containing protein n=2 Tax=Aspergillus ochraceoroseus TaxID=138278 RepID=A0A2T5M8R1_9EURO|nr:uncharacterized protein P175DRAFT_0520762 [Aspergillus ochraceoroseus IBT 24754]KKK19139.1 hypothetical protein AOCH_004354 [Aspergillus ochraceoroseus]PTU24918.1 hypothetical protein P175DRAFT_0520762 [Aspergillus ochraceoroseus IBT 24754]
MVGTSQPNGPSHQPQNFDKTLNCPAPWLLGVRSSREFVTWVVAIAVFTDVFIYGMVVPILPQVLKTRVVVPNDQLQQWMSILLAAYGGALLIGSPIFGYFADRTSSRQAPFLFGLLALGGSTVMFWVARTLSSLVVARVLQGLSAAVVWTVGMALIVDTVGQDQAGKAMGYVSMAMTLGTVFGPFLGGVLLSKTGYHSVFVVAMALIVLDIILRLVMVEHKTASKWVQTPTVEEEGLLGRMEDQERAYEAASTNTSKPTPHEDTAEPLFSKGSTRIPGIIRLLCSGRLLVVLQATVVEAIAYSSFDTVLPLYVMDIFHWGPMGIGLCFLPLFTPSFTSTYIGAAVDHYGARQIAFLGFLLDIPTFLLLQLVTQNTTRDQLTLFILLFLAGLASTLKVVSLMVEVSRIVEQREKEIPGIFGKQGGTAQAYGLFNVAWSGGQVLGPLLAGFLVDWAGWGTMVSVFAAGSGVTAVVLWVSARG